MKTIVFRGLLVLAMTLSLGAFAADEAPAAGATGADKPADAAAPAAEAEKPVAVTITGDNYCLIAAYGAGAKPAANAEGFKNALRVTSAIDADGKEIADLAGKTLHYLPTEAAAPLSAGEENVGKSFAVKGQLYASAGVLVVESFEAAAAADEDWAPLPTGTLSGQQVL